MHNPNREVGYFQVTLVNIQTIHQSVGEPISLAVWFQPVVARLQRIKVVRTEGRRLKVRDDELVDGQIRRLRVAPHSCETSPV